MSERQLQRLVRRASRGDKEAFNELIQLKVRDITFIAIGLMGNKVDGEDAAQEAVIVIERDIKKLRQPKYFNSWVYRVVFNVCMKEKGRQKQDLQRSRDGEDAVLGLEESDPRVLPELKVSQDADRELLQNALCTLPQSYRLGLMLFYYENMSYKEIAKALDTTEYATASMLSRAKQKLRIELEKEGMSTSEQFFIQYKKQEPATVFSLSGAFALFADRLADPAMLSRVSNAAVDLASAGAIGGQAVAGSFAGKALAAGAGVAAVAAVSFGVVIGTTPSSEGDFDNTNVQPVASVNTGEETTETITEKSIDIAVTKQPDNAELTAVIKGEDSPEWQDFLAKRESFVFEGSGTQGPCGYELYSEVIGTTKHYLAVIDGDTGSLDEPLQIDIEVNSTEH